MQFDTSEFEAMEEDGEYELNEKIEELENKIRNGHYITLCQCNVPVDFCDKCFEHLIYEIKKLGELKKRYLYIMGRQWKLKGKFGEDFRQKYNPGKMIGAGGSGQVYIGNNKASKQVAIKYVPERMIKWTITENGRIPTELWMLKRAQGWGTIQLIDSYKQDDSYIYVMENLDNSMDLEAYLALEDELCKKKAARIFKLIVLCVTQIITRGVVHMDLSPQNIIISPDTLQVKLIDFGLSEEYKENNKYKFKQSEIYAPPEWIIRREIEGVPSSTWSLGLILFRMVQGKLPFNNKEEICLNRLRFDKKCSKEFKTVVAKLLKKKFWERTRLVAILEDKWFSAMEEEDFH